MKKFTVLLSLVSLCSIFVQTVAACGPFTVDPLFSFTRHPDYPLQEYAKGKIGIVPASYGRMSLFVFYRELNNIPLSAKEQEQFTRALHERIGSHVPDGEDNPIQPLPKNNAVEQWKTSRAKVFAGNTKLETEKRLPDEYFNYTSCLDDAFRTAANALEERISKHGINEFVKEWLNGQDAVFSNCSHGTQTPADVGQNSPEWLKKDRAYQKAAALLYAEKHTEARAEFQKISRDNNSPWKNTANFVIARTYIREASLMDENLADYLVPMPDPTFNSNSNRYVNVVKPHPYDDPGNAPVDYPKLPLVRTTEQKKTAKVELYQKAETKLKEILADPSMNDFHDSANRLLGLVGFRATPSEQRRKLAEKLVQKSENPNFYNELIDYVWLLDKVDAQASDAGQLREQKEAEKSGKEYDYNYDLKRQDIPSVELGADLTDWLFTYQTNDGFAHSYDKWKKTKGLHWLVAALYQSKKDSPNLAELMNEADKIKADSPAFATLRHHQIRLLIEMEKPGEAKQKLNEVSAQLNKYPRSTQNDFASQKMQLAQNLDEYLKHAQRLPATFIWSDDANEQGDDLMGNKELSAWKNRTMFDLDSVAQFNQKIPLSVLRQAALNPNLPDHLKKFLVIAGWTRAYVLGNQTVLNEFTPLMAKFAPEYKASGVNPLLAIVRNPSIQIYVPPGYGRENSDPKTIDSIRGNWWCLEKRENVSSPAFLTAAEKTQAAAEQNKLAAGGDSSTFLARSAVEFANQNMTNPITPEILHLAVRSTRYGCKDANTLRFSKTAFDILHKRFPRSEWTKKTPYYFGDGSN